MWTYMYNEAIGMSLLVVVVQKLLCLLLLSKACASDLTG